MPCNIVGKRHTILLGNAIQYRWECHTISLWGISCNIVGNAVQYCGGMPCNIVAECHAILWRNAMQYCGECRAILWRNAMQYCRDAINRVSTLPDKRLSLIPITQTFAAKALFYTAPFFLSGFGNGLFFHLLPKGN